MRAFALLLAGVSLLNVVLHDGVVRHERCAEHGELVDVQVAVAAHDDIARAGLHSADADADDEHDHCPLATHPPRASTAQQVTVHALLARVAPVTHAAPDALGFARRAAWRAISQTGPPARA